MGETQEVNLLLGWTQGTAITTELLLLLLLSSSNSEVPAPHGDKPSCSLLHGLSLPCCQSTTLHLWAQPVLQILPA